MSDRRRKLTDREKDLVLYSQGFKCPGLPHLGIKCGKQLSRTNSVFDHFEQRVFTGSDELKEFQALCTEGGKTSCNAIKTNGKSGAGSAGSDANKRAKVRRLTNKQKMHNYRMAEKLHGLRTAARMYPEVVRLLRRRGPKIANRGFSPGHRPLRSRNNLSGRQ